MDRLFLLDAYALIYRGYYALARMPRFSSQKIDTTAIYGFCNTLDDLLRRETPDYIAVCFDPPHGKTFRHDVYPEYKANREKQPEAITVAVPWIKRILQARNIPVVEVEGYEADDVIGTLSRRAEREGLMTYMMTLDKDYGQLVTDRVYMYRPPLRGEGAEVRDPERICQMYGIERPEQVVDILALEGDASDNVPGCPKVGEVTASKLIGEYHSVENLLANADSIKGALGQRIRENARQIEFSKFLVTIKTDVPMDVEPEQLKCVEPDYEALAAIYRELEFKTLLSRLPKQELRQAPAPGQQPSLFDDLPEPEEPRDELTAAPIPEHALLSTAAEVRDFAVSIAGAPRVALVTHTDGADAMTARLLGVAVVAPDRAAYIEMPPLQGLEGELLEPLKPLLQGSATTIVGDDLKRAMILLANRGIELTAPLYDVVVARYVLASESSHELANIVASMLHRRLLDYDKTATERRKITFEAPVDAAAFMCQRAQACLDLVDPLDRALAADGVTSVVTDIEFPLIPVLARMERQGMRIDTNELAELSKQLTARLADLEAQVYSIAGVQFNVGSPAQVGEILFERLKIDPKARKTKRGAWSTTEDILEKYAPEHPIVGLILDIRGLRKLLATYVDALPRMINPATGKLHTTFNQTVTATGRISSTNPNLQNIPVRTDDGRLIRRAFIADPGCLLLSADYSQIELRLMADISGDEELISAFGSGEDVHRSTAAKIFHTALADVTADQRRAAKTANFGIIYGISAFGLAERLGIPRGEAKDLIDGYFRSYPGVKQYIDSTVEQARQRGYVATTAGRRRQLPDITSRNATLRGWAERNAVNAPLQGSAADIIKRAMIAIDAEITRRGLRSRMILQVHDELIFNVLPDEAAEMQQLVTDLMQRAYNGRVQLTVGSGLATNWLDAH